MAHTSLSHEDARTVDGVLYDTYQESATELGLFVNKKEAEYAFAGGHTEPKNTMSTMSSIRTPPGE